MTKVEELRFAVLDGMFLSTSNKLLDSLILAVHAEGVAEGAEQIKAEIRNGGELIESAKPWYIVPASLLAPKPERGKPSQALLDELSEICGGEVTYDPASVLSPTKESLNAPTKEKP